MCLNLNDNQFKGNRYKQIKEIDIIMGLYI